MKKLSLNLDALEVTSFDVVAPAEEKATARAWAWSDDSVCPTVTEGGPKCGSRPPI